MIAISSPFVLSLLLALLFSATHLMGKEMSFLRRTPRSVWLSMAGGVSVAYVFVHLLPELAAHQETFRREAQQEGGAFAAFESHVYVIALVGLAGFYGLDRLARLSARGEQRSGRPRQPPLAAFWVHLGAFALYNCLVGYLLLHREGTGLTGLLVYAFAMALHFVVNDQGLRQYHGETYDRYGRWLLAAAPLLGWIVGLVADVPELTVAALFALLAGGIVLNVLKEELPEERESRFWAFGIGAFCYSALLLAIG